MPDVSQIHGSVVAMNGQAVLITGASGCGKSTLAFEMIALGADLVADDRVDLRRDGDRVVASPPATTAGHIEARQIGLMQLPYTSHATIVVIADLDEAEPDRLPYPRNRDLLDIQHPVILCKDRAGLAAILLAVLRYGMQRID